MEHPSSSRRGNPSANGYTHVVAPIDPAHQEHRALRTATEFARRAHVPVTILAAAHEPHPLLTAWSHGLDTEGIDVRFEQIDAHEGTAAAVAAYVNRLPGALACVPTKAAGRFRETALHPTAQSILRLAHRPVVLVGPNADGHTKWNDIAAFVDNAAASTATTTFAAQLASDADATLTILRVTRTRYALVADTSEDADLRRYASIAHQRGVPVVWDSLHDASPARGILHWLDGQNSTLPVLGAHSHPDVSHLRSPSVVAKVAHRTRTPVVVVPAESTEQAPCDD